nr:alpha-2-macroglobulin family protein [Pseudenhygromyxa sp. WMMC2535]
MPRWSSSWLYLIALIALIALSSLGLGCKAGARLGERAPRVDDQTKVLEAFDPASLAASRGGGLDLEGGARSGDPEPPELPTLPAPEVLDYGPIGETNMQQDIQLRFNRAMVPLGEKQRVAPEQAGLRITPAIPGEVFWAEPTRLVFEPAQPLPLATEFHVQFTASLAAVDGPNLDVALDWRFATEGPELRMSLPWEHQMGHGDDSQREAHYDWKTPVELYSSQAIGLAELRRHTRAEAIDANGQRRPVDVRVRKLIAAPDAWQTPPQFEVRPATRWPAGSEVVVHVDAGLVGKVGPRPMANAAAFSFRVAPGVEVTHFECERERYADGCDLGPIYLRFSAPLPRASAKRVRVSPSEHGSGSLAVDRDYDWSAEPPKALDAYSGVMVWGDFERGKTYTVTLDDGLRDVHGQAITGERSFEVQFVEPPPSLELGPGGTLPSHRPLEVGVDSRHVEALAVRVAVFDRDHAPVALTERWTGHKPRWPSKDHARIVEAIVPLSHSGQYGWSSLPIDLAKYTGGKPATVMVDVAVDDLLPRAQGRALPSSQRTLVQITNLGIVALGSLPGGLVRVARLDDDRPVAGAQLELLPANANPGDGRVLGKTDADGLLRLPSSAELPSEAFLRARAGDDSVVLSIASLHAHETTPPNEALRPGESVRAALMTERSLYQGGEQVRAMGWAAIASPYALSGLRPLPAGTEVQIELRDRLGELIASRSVRAKAHGKFWATLELPESPSLGDYNLDAKLLGASARTTLQIKDFPIPEFEVTAQSEHGDLHHGESTTISVDASYYYGGRVPMARLRTTTECSPRAFRPPGVEVGWSTAPQPNLHHGTRAPAVGLVHTKVGEDGHHSYSLTPTPTHDDVPALCTHSVAVADLSNREVGAEASVWMHPPFYLASHSPRRVDYGADLHLPLRTLDYDGTPAAGRSVEVSLTRSWSEPEYANEDGERRFVGWQRRSKTLPRCEVKTDAEGQASCDFKALDHGSYEVVIRGRGPASERSSARYEPRIETWLWVPEPNPHRNAPRPSVDSLTLSLDDDSPSVGDSLRVEARSPWTEGAGVLVLAKGGLHELWPLRFQDGRAEHSLRVDEAWVPGVHFEVFAVAPPDKTHPLPRLERAAASVELGSEGRELRVAIVAPEEAQTGQTIPIEVHAHDRFDRPARGHVSVWAVDEAIHALSPPRVPSFVETFVVAFSAGLSVTHGYAALSLPFAVSGDPYLPLAFDPKWRQHPPGRGYGSGSASGSAYGLGGGTLTAAGGPAAPARQNFSSAPIFIGDAELGADGVARVEGELPDNLTTFRLSAVVSSPLPDAADARVEPRFGLADARVRVTQPLVVRLAMPRVMRPGDSAEVGVIVDNLRAGPGRLSLALDLLAADGVLELVGQGTSELSVDAGAQVRVPFRVRALATGTPELEVRVGLAPTAKGNATAHDALRLPLVIEAERTLSDRVAVYGSLGGEDSVALLPFRLPTQVDPNFGGLSVSVGSTILGGVEDAVAYLVRYPYGCVEQTSSSLLPLVPLGQLAEQGYPLGIEDTKTYVRAGVDRLRAMQLSSGGFSYWPGGATEAPYASAYATWVLTLAARAGYEVPEPMLDRAESYLRRMLSTWLARTAPPEDQAIEAALIAWSLSERGAAPPEALDELYAERHRLPVFAAAMLDLAIANTDADDPRLPGLLTELQANIDEREAVAKVETSGPTWTWYWDTEVRSSALVTLAMLAIDPEHPLVPKLARGLLAARQGGRWANTQENALVLLALAEYAAVYEAEAPDFEGRVWLANQPVAAIQIHDRSFGFEDGFTAMDALLAAVHGEGGAAQAARGGADQLILERAGSGRMYYRVGLEWASTATDLPAKAEGVAIRRQLRSAQGPLDEAPSVAPGTLLALDVELESRAALDYLAAELPLPAGLEAVDLELGKGGAAMRISGARAGWVSHQELHRDRALIFADHLPPGTHRTTVFLRATTPGDYVMPAASAELMYYPEIYARTSATRLSVR